MTSSTSSDLTRYSPLDSPPDYQEKMPGSLHVYQIIPSEMDSKSNTKQREPQLMLHNSVFVGVAVFVFILLFANCHLVLGDDTINSATETNLLPIGMSLSRTCFEGQAWCFSRLGRGQDMCTPLLFSDKRNNIDVQRNGTSWTFNITEAHQKHTGWYRCGNAEILVNVLEPITLYQGDHFERTCNTDTEPWCFTKPGAKDCQPLLFSDPQNNLLISRNNSLWTFDIMKALSSHTGRYRCGDQDIYIQFSETVNTTIHDYAEGTTNLPTGTHKISFNLYFLFFILLIIPAVLIVAYCLRKTSRNFTPVTTTDDETAHKQLQLHRTQSSQQVTLSVPDVPEQKGSPV